VVQAPELSVVHVAITGPEGVFGVTSMTAPA
jgi:hypothetical protein